MFKIQTYKMFKRTLFITTKLANFRGNPLCQATKRQLNDEKWSKKTKPLIVFFLVELCCFPAQRLEELFVFQFCFPGESFSYRFSFSLKRRVMSSDFLERSKTLPLAAAWLISGSITAGQDWKNRMPEYPGNVPLNTVRTAGSKYNVYKILK